MYPYMEIHMGLEDSMGETHWKNRNPQIAILLASMVTLSTLGHFDISGSWDHGLDGSWSTTRRVVSYFLEFFSRCFFFILYIEKN